MNALLEAIKAEVNPDGSAGLRVIPLNYTLGDRLPSAVVPATQQDVAKLPPAPQRRTGTRLISGCYKCQRTERELKAIGHKTGCWFDQR